MSESQATEAEVIVADDAGEHAAFAAELMGRAIHRAVSEQGSARIAISGGSTPAEAYRRLAQLDLPWASTHWFWVDERAVPPDSARSNHRAASAELRLDGGRVPATQVHRMEAEAPDLGAAAARYENLLRASFGVASAVAFDVMTLGIGDDGHTASLFPGTGATDVCDRLVTAVAAQPARSLEARLTLTAPVLCEARLVLVLARGAAKRDVVRAARAPGQAEEVPARVIHEARGRVVWLLDRDAAGEPAF